MSCTEEHSLPRPRVYLYPEWIGTPQPYTLTYDARLEILARQLRRSRHHTTDGRCADFLLVHSYITPGTPPSSRHVLALFDRIARELPYWNASRSGRLARRVSHLLISPCDHGPGDCMYDRKSWSAPKHAARGGGLVRWRELNPASPRRAIGFITLSGAPAPNPTNFLPGVDVRVPAWELHQCGPFCGMPHASEPDKLAALRALRAHSPWPLHFRRLHKLKTHRLDLWRMLTNSSVALPAPLQARRPYRLFFAGRATKAGVRADLFAAHGGRADFLLHDTSGRFPPADATKWNSSAADVFPRAMASSDFCASPLGQSDGDSDRYLAAMLYGCVPVFLHPGERPPFDDLLEWADFSLRLDGAADVARLPAILDAVSDKRLVAMRLAIAKAWTTMLWARPGRTPAATLWPAPPEADKTPARPRVAMRDGGHSYLGEDARDVDALGAFLSVLRRRMSPSEG
jgi:hypothetical protein